MPVVSLLTDFGLVDPYVGVAKAVIFSICPRARVVDISHGVEAFNVGMGAFLLAEAAPFFPAGTVHVAVVDPGVGSGRRPLAVKTSRCVFVGPDNGLLMPAAEAEGIREVFEITNRRMMMDEVSSTFHGRDIFAPCAAHLACGWRIEDCGRRISDYVKSPYDEATIEGGVVACVVLHLDRFGNIITNLKHDSLAGRELALRDGVQLIVKGKRVASRRVRTFSDLRVGEVGVVFGSHGFLEVVARERSAAATLRVKPGAGLRFRLRR